MKEGLNSYPSLHKFLPYWWNNKKASVERKKKSQECVSVFSILLALDVHETRKEENKLTMFVVVVQHAARIVKCRGAYLSCLCRVEFFFYEKLSQMRVMPLAKRCIK